MESFLMGLKKDTKKQNYFITPGSFPVHIVIWCPDWFLQKKYRDLYFRKWVLDVESDFPLNGCIVSREKIWPIFKGHADIRRSICSPMRSFINRK